MTVVVVLLAVAFVVVHLAPTRARLALWCVIIAAAVVPWASYLTHTHWDRVQWVPFVPPPDVRLRDLAVNVLLYVPFGVFFVEARPLSPSIRRAVVWAAAFSVLTELTQVFSHGRFPTSTDVLMNVLGAFLGATAARLHART